MKIVHISNYYFDKLGYHENLLPRYQQKIGNDVILITSDRSLFPYNQIGDHEEKEGRFLIKVLETKGESKQRFVIFKNLYDCLVELKPDYIFHHGVTAPSLLDVAKYKKKNPSVFVAADCHEDLNNSGRIYPWKLIYYNFLWSKVWKNLIPQIDVIFGVTPARCYFAHLELGIPWDKIRFLPQGADVDEAEYWLENKHTRSGNRQITMITGGKWTRNKKLENLLIAMKGLPINLRVFGKIYDNKLLKLIQEQQNVEFLGWLDRKHTFKEIVNSDIAIWISFHTTLMEDAIAAELPVILRYYGSTCHLIRGNGQYLFSGTRKEINFLLRTLLKNLDLIISYRNRAKDIKALLSYYSIAKESIEYYHSLEQKTLHEIFMNDYLCRFDGIGWYKTK